MKIIYLLFILIPQLAFGSIEVGTGFSSSHSGRKVPTLALAYSDSSFALSAYSSGVRNDYYYHSSYGVHAFRLKTVGEAFGGQITTGIGLGSMYSKRGFKDTNDTSEQTSNDYVFGPAFRLNWTIANSFYVNVDATYGLRDIFSHLTLNFQDVISTSIGVRLW